jgi:hypothetical protein
MTAALLLQGFDFVQCKQKTVAGVVWRRSGSSGSSFKDQGNMNTILCVLFERFDDSDFARKRHIGKDLIMFRLDLNSIPCSEFNSL